MLLHSLKPIKTHLNLEHSHARNTLEKKKGIVMISLSFFSLRGAWGPKQPILLLWDHLLHLGREVQSQRTLYDDTWLPLRQSLGPQHGEQASGDVSGAWTYLSNDFKNNWRERRQWALQCFSDSLTSNVVHFIKTRRLSVIKRSRRQTVQFPQYIRTSPKNITTHFFCFLLKLVMVI